jgi:hypothetical protein
MVLKVIRPLAGKPPMMSPQQKAQDAAAKQAKADAAKAAQQKVIADKLAAEAAIKKAADEKAAKAAASSKVSTGAAAGASGTTATPEVGFFEGAANFVSDIGDGIVQAKNKLVEGTVAAYDTVTEAAGQAYTNTVEKIEEVGENLTEQFNELEVVKQFKAFLDKEEAKEKNFKLFMSKIGIYPKVSVTKDTQVSSPETELTSITMNAVYNDQLVFQALKAGYNNVNAYDANTVSALLPIKFSFTVHGVSGIKRGDKFKVIGIPRQYEENGFFQGIARYYRYPRNGRIV